MVLVAVLLVPLLGMAAFAIDLSYWQAGANQLQTVADAAALAGARGFQTCATVQQTCAENAATAVAGQNVAINSTSTVSASSVLPAFYNPVTGIVATRDWTDNDINAVRVTASATGQRVLAAVTGLAAPTISRTAVAWIANINSGTCIKPWALPYTVLYDSVVSATGLTSSITPTSPSTNPPFRNNLSQAQITALNNLTTTNAQATKRTILLRGPVTPISPLPTGASPATIPEGNQWLGYNYQGNGSPPAGNAPYQYQVGNCGLTGTPVAVSIGSNGGTTLPSAGADYECWTVSAAMGSNLNSCNNANYLSDYSCSGGTNGCPPERTCVFRPIGNPVTSSTIIDAGCYAPSYLSLSGPANNPQVNVNIPTNAPVGVNISVAWGDATGTGSNLTSYRQVGTFRLLCVFRTFSQGSGAPRTSVFAQSPQERCVVPGGSTYTNLPAGTLVGIITGLSDQTIGAGTVLGNTTSFAQRLILVQ
jgi:Flp pilus assembly protein TadG